MPNGQLVTKYWIWGAVRSPSAALNRQLAVPGHQASTTGRSPLLLARPHAKATKRRSVRDRKGQSRRAGRVEPVIAAGELIRVCGVVDEATAALETAGRVASVLR